VVFPACHSQIQYRKNGGFLGQDRSDFTDRESRGAVAALEPAVWTLARFECYKENFNGAVAQMRLEPGEIVNLGHLIVDVYTVRRKGLFHGAIRRARAKVEDLEPEAIESLRKRAPSTYAKAKQRYFAINSKLKWHDVPPPQD
jgi:hypothetical protein